MNSNPDGWALSVLNTTRDMAFRHTNLVGDYYIYAQAATLAIATIDRDMVVVGSARLRYRRAAYVGERIFARSKVGTWLSATNTLSVYIPVLLTGKFLSEDSW